MKSLIEITCPHCGTQGQVLLPPVGVMVVGPCPRCSELVAVFCGRALALNKDIMYNGSPEEKKRHLLEVLMVFLEERITETLLQTSMEAAEGEAGLDSSTAFEELRDAFAAEGGVESGGEARDVKDISSEEFDRFVQTELPLLDNPNYFKAIFD